MTFLQTGRDTAGELLQLEVVLDSGGWVPRHAHVRQDERVEVLAGTVTLRVGGTERTLQVGDSADVPRRELHYVRNSGTDEARFLLEVRPARRMQGAMRGLFAAMSLLRPLVRKRKAGR